LNIPKRKIELDISKNEMDKRMRNWKKPAPKVRSGYLARYAKMVTSADTGAVFK